MREVSVSSPHLVVIIDNNAAEATALSTVLTTAGYGVTITADGVAGLLAVEELHPALVLVAWDLPFLTGAIVAHALKVGLDQPPPVVALTAPGEQDPPTVGDNVAAVVPRQPTVAEILAVVGALLPPAVGMASA